jgi:hypothetical protein
MCALAPPFFLHYFRKQTNGRGIYQEQTVFNAPCQSAVRGIAEMMIVELFEYQGKESLSPMLICIGQRASFGNIGEAQMLHLMLTSHKASSYFS